MPAVAKAGSTQAPKKKTAIPNKDVLSRVNFLHQASLLLAQKSPNLSRRYALDMKSVCQKSQLQMDRSIKRKICKRCHSVMLEGQTSTRTIENHSRDKRPECDEVVMKCDTCCATKRFRLTSP